MSIKQIIKRGLEYIFKGVPNNVIEVKISYLSPDARLADKKIIVTGGGRGLGYAMAKRFVEEGAEVLISGRNEEVLKKAADKLNCKYLLLNVKDIGSFSVFLSKAEDMLGGLNSLVNNAGITKDNLLMRMKESDFDAVVDVNLKGTWNCMKHVTKIMMKQRYGRIISMSSVVGVMGNAGQVNYAATKSGIIGMTMSLAREVGSRGITVNAVAPGFIKTAMTDVLPDDIKENMIKQIPLGTLGEVSDIANTVVFLASDDAKYITGQTIHVDGGMAM